MKKAFVVVMFVYIVLFPSVGQPDTCDDLIAAGASQIDVRAFGAVADGFSENPTDNNAAIQNAVNCAAGHHLPLMIFGDFYWANVVTVSSKADIFLSGSIVLNKYNGQLKIVSEASGTTITGGTITSNVVISRVTQDVYAPDPNAHTLRIYVDSTAGWKYGDKVHSSWLWRDHDYATLPSENIGTNYIDVDIWDEGHNVQHPETTEQRPAYLPPNSPGGLRQPKGSYIMQHNDWLPAVLIYGADNVTLRGVRFYRSAGQALKSVNAHGLKVLDCRFESTVLDTVSFAVDASDKTTDVEVDGCSWGTVYDIGKQAVTLNGNNSTFVFRNNKIWSTATDSFFYLYNRGANSSYYFINNDIRNPKPDYMQKGDWAADDHGQHPNSIWRLVWDPGGDNAKLIQISDTTVTNISGSILINSAMNVSDPDSEYGDRPNVNRLDIVNSTVDDGINLSNTTIASDEVSIINSRIVSAKATFFNPGTTGKLILRGSTFERVDGDYTDEHEDDDDYYGAVIKATDYSIVTDCRFISSVSDPETYNKCPCRVASDNAVLTAPFFGACFPYYTTVGNKTEGALYSGIPDGGTNYTATPWPPSGNIIHIAGINGGRLGGLFWRDASTTPSFIKIAPWTATEGGAGADWFIPEYSRFDRVQNNETPLVVTRSLQTTTSSAVSSGGTVIPVASVSGVIAGDFASIKHSDGTVGRYVVASVGGSNVTLSSGLTADVDSGGNLSLYAVATSIDSANNINVDEKFSGLTYTNNGATTATTFTLPASLWSTAANADYYYARQFGNAGNFYLAIDVATDSAGNVYVTDYSRVEKFTSDGAFIKQWGSTGSNPGQFLNPGGVEVNSEGYVYVVDTENNRVQKFKSGGAFVKEWGSYGSGNGQFNLPHGIAIDSAGYVYVTDLYNYRIQKFTSGCVCKQMGKLRLWEWTVQTSYECGGKLRWVCICG